MYHNSWVLYPTLSQYAYFHILQWPPPQHPWHSVGWWWSLSPGRCRWVDCFFISPQKNGQIIWNKHGQIDENWLDELSPLRFEDVFLVIFTVRHGKPSCFPLVNHLFLWVFFHSYATNYLRVPFIRLHFKQALLIRQAECLNLLPTNSHIGLEKHHCWIMFCGKPGISWNFCIYLSLLEGIIQLFLPGRSMCALF